MVSPLQLIAAASSVAATAASPLDGRIINGTVAPIGKYLFVTGLRATEVGQSICGAALIAPKVLLTSASCLKSYFAFASVGSHYLQGNVDGERIKIVKKTAHPQFNATSFEYDFAIFELETAVKIAAPVKVAFDDDEYAPPNTIAWVRGWGLNATNSNQFSQVLLQADVPIWDQAACAGDSKDWCFGDNGGPLTVWKGAGEFVVGLASWGPPCASKNIPGVYARVSATRSFIEPFLPAKPGCAAIMIANLGLPPKRSPLDRSYSSPEVHVTSLQSTQRRPRFSHRSSTLPPSSPVHDPPVDVFLGGSCNPTTWRRDVAIPRLDAAGISFYNPQVDEWYEDLIAVESRAKDTASVVLFVIDNCTRAIVSMNEAAEFMCCGRTVLLVVEDMPLHEQVFLEGACLSSLEITDLNDARACLRHFSMEYPHTTLCSSVEAAVDVLSAHLASSSMLDPRRSFSLRSARLRKRSSVVLSRMKKKTPPNALQRSSSSSSVIEYDGGSSSDIDHTIELVYLGGNVTNTTWRATLAIPRLQMAGLPYYSPLGDCSKMDSLMKVKAGLVLMVIPNTCRSIAAMIDTIALVCSGRAVMLVIEPMVEGLVVVEDGRAVTGREFKDLVRARMYLEETASRHDICTFESVAHAVDAIVAKAAAASRK
ncbi:hypothetical protein DYB28_004716 [Aphanomyces astaci]|uniref:Peptidase S1 domain-containing protein n=1 Tax=Aphanomyces astaci TaxID=112090 RepID=A0A397BD36_APHAT|nr:hypothetical protein DYB36_009363 [Aphanomyces astaci]RLO03681.1 hypothetical protein DYB28_004716 [Aphanomyces astaci]